MKRFRTIDNTPIDFVVTYVSGNDTAWLEERSKFFDEAFVSSINADCRYRDWGTLKYWFRGVAKYAPWVNHVYIVIDRSTTIPNFLNLESDKLKVVYHDEFIPNEYLPTYNSCMIELFLHRIQGLSEQFVYFNDDFFLIRPTKKSDFFINGMPCHKYWEKPFIPYGRDCYESQCFNNISLINLNFDKKTQVKAHPLKYITITRSPWVALEGLSTRQTDGFGNIFFAHTPNALRKSTYEEVWLKESERLKKAASHRFRTYDDFNQCLFFEWDIAGGQFKNRPFKSAFYIVDTSNISDCVDAILNHSYKSICINDNEGIGEREFGFLTERLIGAFENILPDSCC